MPSREHVCHLKSGDGSPRPLEWTSLMMTGEPVPCQPCVYQLPPCCVPACHEDGGAVMAYCLDSFQDAGEGLSANILQPEKELQGH